MKNKIVVLDAQTTSSNPEIWNPLEKYGQVTVYPSSTKEEIIERVKDATIALTNKAVIDKEVLEHSKNLKLISVLATGYNIIDLNAAKAADVTVCNVPGYSTDSVAQLTFALLLEITNRVGIHDTAVKDGQWSRCGQFTFRLCDLMELAGKTLGIYGFGAIGRKVAEIGTAFGMKVITNSSRPLPPNVEKVDFEGLLERSDVLSLNSALIPDRFHVINAEAFKRMKPTAILINTARGALVDENALLHALDNGQIAAAGLDVMEKEPPAADCKITGHPKCVVTPHIAWQSNEAISRLLEITVNNVKSFLEGEAINVVV